MLATDATMLRMIDDGGVRAMARVATSGGRDETIWLSVCRAFAKISGHQSARQLLMDEGAASTLVLIIGNGNAVGSAGAGSAELETQSLATATLGNLSAGVDRPTLAKQGKELELGVALEGSEEAAALAFPSGFGVIEAVGGLLVRAQSFKVQRYCACCLGNLSKSLECHDALLARPIWDAMWALTAFPDQIAKRQCTIYFGNLSCTDMGRARLGGTREGCSNVLKLGLAALHDLETYRDEAIAIHATYALAQMASDGPTRRRMVVAGGGIERDGVVLGVKGRPSKPRAPRAEAAGAAMREFATDELLYKGAATEWHDLPLPMETTITTLAPGEGVLLLACLSRSCHDSAKTNTSYRLVLEVEKEPEHVGMESSVP